MLLNLQYIFAVIYGTLFIYAQHCSSQFHILKLSFLFFVCPFFCCKILFFFNCFAPIDTCPHLRRFLNLKEKSFYDIIEVTNKKIQQNWKQQILFAIKITIILYVQEVVTRPKILNRTILSN